MENKVLKNTESVCPKCLKRITAQRIKKGDEVYLRKECPEHGTFKVLVWKGNPKYEDWPLEKIPITPSICQTEIEQGCPYDCGLCPDHRQETCCVLLEITTACNLYCPVCFAQAQEGKREDPDLQEISRWYDKLKEPGFIYNIQISGGEPTIRDDLPEIIKMGHEKGYPYIQLNTNGLRLGKEPSFVKKLKEAGLNSVFLQFDGTNDEIYRKIRGKPLLDIKKAAIENCAREGLGVVLVPTLVPGVNLDNIGEIISFAIEHMPGVRGVHFQPISYFGRYPESPPEDRITIPEILRALEKQTSGMIKAENFAPPAAENSYCSFQGNFILTEEGVLKSIKSQVTGKCCSPPVNAQEAVQKSRAFVARQWVAPEDGSHNGFCGCAKGGEDLSIGVINTESLDIFLNQARYYTLAISGMAFQDAWTLDLERLRDCKVHVFSPDNKLIPFCAYNLTDMNGESLYRK